jgi:hypothetical protein
MTSPKSHPDFEAFGRTVLADWPVADIDGSDLFDWALACHLIREVEGGFNPDQHIDTECTCPEKGDPWYEYNFPLDRTASPSIAELEAEVERLNVSLWMVKAVINAECMGKTTFEYLAGVVDKALTPKEPTP